MSKPMPVATTVAYRNPHATLPFSLRFLVVRNTPDEEIEQNIRANSLQPIDWVGHREPHDGVAVMAGGGASLSDHLGTINQLRYAGATIFAGNAASQYLRANGISADYQVLGDAKPETAQLVDTEAPIRLIASQVNPATLEKAMDAGITRLWHLMAEGVEDWLPAERVKRGGYSMILGSSTVGDFAIRLAYVLGYRTFHVFGYDSSHREGRSHAYAQPMNDSMPCTTVEWAGKSYLTSLPMKAQAEKFQVTARLLQKEGCTIEIYGNGLLQHMWRTPATDLPERDKYRMMWQFADYRAHSPGERAVETFLAKVKPVPSATVIDFGCGTGRASLALQERGFNPLLVDFADNCRDQEAILLPFLEADLTQPIPLRSPYGLCCDLMEHIPETDVETVIRNIMEAAGQVFFQIATVPDKCGLLIGDTLHLTVRPEVWWRNLILAMGYAVEWSEARSSDCQLVVRR